MQQRFEFGTTNSVRKIQFQSAIPAKSLRDFFPPVNVLTQLQKPSTQVLATSSFKWLPGSSLGETRGRRILHNEKSQEAKRGGSMMLKRQCAAFHSEEHLTSGHVAFHQKHS